MMKPHLLSLCRQIQEAYVASVNIFAYDVIYDAQVSEFNPVKRTFRRPLTCSFRLFWVKLAEICDAC